MDLYKLLEKREKKSSYRDELFPEILKKCYRRIESNNDVGNLETTFTMPTFFVGYPKINRAECVDFLLNTLIKNGFDAYATGDNNEHIHISWKQAYDKYKLDKHMDKNLLEFEPAVEAVACAPVVEKTNIRRADKSIFSKQQPTKFSLLN